MTLDDRWSTILADLRAEGRYRELTLPRGVDLASNDYLGYGPRLWGDVPPPDLPRSGMASRLLRGHHPVWEAVEAGLARWHGAEAALVFPSGYTANEGLLSTIIEPQDWVASDALNHASIIDGLRLAKAERYVHRHHDWGQLEDALHAVGRARLSQRQLFLVTESLFGMDGDRTPLEPLVALAERYDAQVIVDEAHATGCFGPAGSGCVDAAGLRSRVLATVHTGGKALGVAGAYVCGSARLKELLVNRCRHFLFTTALPPMVGAGWLDMLERVPGDDASRAALHAAAAWFRRELARQGVAGGGADYIVPILLGDDARAVAAARRVQEAGFDVRALRPPSVPPGTARLRISIHADHDVAMLSAAAAAVAEAVLP